MGKTNKKKNVSVQNKKPTTRKELRKQKRQEKKRIKHVFFSQKKAKGVLNEKKSGKKTERTEKAVQQPIISDGSDEEIPSDDEVSLPGDNLQRPEKPVLESPMDRFIKAAEKKNKLVKEITGGSRKRRIAQLKAENEKEDRLIRQLEKKLKIDKKRGDKSVPKCFDDGFDYILELCLPENINKMYEAAKEAADLDEEGNCSSSNGAKAGTSQKKENKREIRLKDAEKKYFGDDSELESIDSELEETDEDALENGGGSEDDEDASDIDGGSEEDESASENDENSEEGEFSAENNEEVSESESEDNDRSHRYVRAPKYNSDESNQDDFDEDFEENSEQSDVENDEEDDDDEDLSGKEENWEDIYGRNRDKEGNVVTDSVTNGKYIPPHLRAKKSTETSESPEKSEKIQRLRKQLKGWLNRLAEANLVKIAKDTEDLYMKNSRHDMNHTLCSLILESIVTPTAAAERMVLEHCLFIAVLHANVGNEVGAHFLEALVEKFDTKLNQIESYDVENKELDNVVLFICHLYTFRICQHSLIFEMLKRVSAELSEKCVECILVILRSVGFALRKDDPAALKEFIGEIRQEAEKLPDALKENARLKFMLDILIAVKNNNMLKIPNYDPSLAEHLRKVLKGILKNGKYVTTLNITMDDLLSTDQRGKWWIVGSAWTGRQLDGQEGTSTSRDKQRFSQDMLELARKHRMNTEDRRNVFCTLMAANDQTDAVNQLMELSIKDNRVIATILLYCCICEPTYNAFYAVVAEKLCYTDRKHRLAIQFASWDKMKELGNLTDQQIENFSKFLAHLIEEGAQPLSIIKVIDYGQIDRASVKLVRRILLTILLKDDYTCKKIFSKIAPSAQLKPFKNSIKLFLHQFLLQKTNKLDLPKEQLEIVKRRIAIAEEAISADSKVLL